MIASLGMYDFGPAQGAKSGKWKLWNDRKPRDSPQAPEISAASSLPGPRSRSHCRLVFCITERLIEAMPQMCSARP